MDIQLNSIVLQNFQAIRDRTEIPIRPLTFLYGPNSSGKSAIHDALLYVDTVFSGGQHKNLLKRWRYRVPGESEPREMQIAIAGKIVTNSFGFTNDRGADHLPDPFDLFLWNLRADRAEREPHSHLSFKIEITALSNGCHLINLFIDDKCVLRCSANQMDLYQVKCEICTEFFSGALERVAQENGLDPDDSSSYSFTCKFPTNDLHFELTSRSELDESFLGWEKELLQPLNYTNFLCHLANYYIGQFAALRFAPPLVDSDRGTILNDSMIWTDSAIESRLNTHPTIAMLAKSYVASLKPTPHHDSLMNSETLPAEGLHKWVNRCLSDHLFLDQAYEITYAVYGLTPLPLPLTPEKGQVVNHLVECSLIDKVIRTTSFEDVGTGVSCLIPVLASLHGPYSFIQQPELHLHPALQAELGDVCIEATQLSGSPPKAVRHLIETHSENMLLRVLKRIRQTHLQYSVAPVLKIEADDVCVLYFNPLPNGTTAIKHLRITEDGEFMDRWPSGFFAERDQEFQDE
ncbi:MAG: DUF3696 domain-containing protein [Burkholderiaceae bacterium]